MTFTDNSEPRWSGEPAKPQEEPADELWLAQFNQNLLLTAQALQQLQEELRAKFTTHE